MALSRIACVGAGYVGGPSCSVIALKCPHLHVTVCDINADVIDAWQSDTLPVHEPGLQEVIEQTRKHGNLTFTTDVHAPLARAQVIYMCVDTPPKAYGTGKELAADTCNLERAVRNVAHVENECRKQGENITPKVLVIKSTVPVGTCHIMRDILRQQGVHNIAVASNPEFLAEGTAISDMLDPSRVVIGTDPEDQHARILLSTLYSNWIDAGRIVHVDTKSSELCKLVSNALLAQRISSINCVAALCESVGADVAQVSRTAGMDPRIGSKFLNASIGFGGSCFRKDVMSLANISMQNNLRTESEYWRSIVLINEHSKRRFVNRVVQAMFGNVRGKRIALFGFAFKKDTGDVRDTASADIVSWLLEERAIVGVYDPQVQEEDMRSEVRKSVERNSIDLIDQKNLHHHETSHDAARGAHAIIIGTEWDEFRGRAGHEHDVNYGQLYSTMSKPAFLFDGRRVVNAQELRDIGFVAYVIGQ